MKAGELNISGEDCAEPAESAGNRLLESAASSNSDDGEANAKNGTIRPKEERKP